MHEESLIRALLRQAENLAVQHAAIAVEEIELEIGPLSGAEPLLLESAFDRIKGTSDLCGCATLSIRSIDLEALCLDCQRDFAIDDFRFVCRYCESTSLQIMRGDSLTLLNVRLQVTQNENITD